MTSSALLLLGRILLSIIFILSGYGKLADAAGFSGYLTALAVPQPMIMAYLVGLCELVGGVALVVGFKTRIVAVLLALFCIGTAILAHRNFADQAQMMNFLKNMAMAGGFFALAGSGPGAYAVDRRTVL